MFEEDSDKDVRSETDTIVISPEMAEIIDEGGNDTIWKKYSDFSLCNIADEIGTIKKNFFLPLYFNGFTIIHFF